MAEKSIRVNVVSAEERFYEGQASQVVAPAALGEVGILPGHAPMLTLVKPGTVRITPVDDSEEDNVLYISGGILEVLPDCITILADTGVRAEDIDSAKAEEAKRNAEKVLQDKTAQVDYAKALVELAQAAAQLRTLQKIRRKKG